MPLTGTSPAIVVRSGGGEGPWYYTNGSPAVVAIHGCVVGDTILTWTGCDASDYLTYTNSALLLGFTSWPGTGNPMVLVYLLRCTTAGTVKIQTNQACLFSSILAHKTTVPAIHAP